jgi:hypothetical protein
MELLVVLILVSVPVIAWRMNTPARRKQRAIKKWVKRTLRPAAGITYRPGPCK